MYHSCVVSRGLSWYCIVKCKQPFLNAWSGNLHQYQFSSTEALRIGHLQYQWYQWPFPLGSTFSWRRPFCNKYLTSVVFPRRGGREGAEFCACMHTLCCKSSVITSSYYIILLHSHACMQTLYFFTCSCVCNYRCRNQRYGVDFHQDDLCMSGIGTIMLRSGLKEREIIYANYENEVTGKSHI